MESRSYSWPSKCSMEGGVCGHDGGEIGEGDESWRLSVVVPRVDEISGDNNAPRKLSNSDNRWAVFVEEGYGI